MGKISYNPKNKTIEIWQESYSLYDPQVLHLIYKEQDRFLKRYDAIVERQKNQESIINRIPINNWVEKQLAEHALFLIKEEKKRINSVTWALYYAENMYLWHNNLEFKMLSPDRNEERTFDSIEDPEIIKLIQKKWKFSIPQHYKLWKGNFNNKVEKLKEKYSK